MHDPDSKRPSTPAVERKKAWFDSDYKRDLRNDEYKREMKLKSIEEKPEFLTKKETMEFEQSQTARGRSTHLTRESDDATPTSVTDIPDEKISDEKRIDEGRQLDDYVRKFDLN